MELKREVMRKMNIQEQNLISTVAMTTFTNCISNSIQTISTAIIIMHITIDKGISAKLVIIKLQPMKTTIKC